MGRRDDTKAANRAAILEAGREVFAEHGYDAIGVRDIVRGTALASGTFYNYFPDKEAVFRAIVEEFGSTVPVHPGFAVRVDALGNLVVTKEES